MMIIPPALISGSSQAVTLLGYGALLSESSSRLTFPHLSNFRHVRVKHHKRVFAHPHLFLIKEELIDPMSSLHLATLSAEPSDDASSFVVAAFDVVLSDEQRVDFVKREPEYDIVSTPYYDINCDDDDNSQPLGNGIICLASRDCDLRDIDHLHAISTKLKDKGEFGTGHLIRGCFQQIFIYDIASWRFKGLAVQHIHHSLRIHTWLIAKLR